MSTKEEFIHKLVDNLNQQNKSRLERADPLLDVCFMVSVLEQQFDKYGQFAKDITKHDSWIDVFTDDLDGYGTGKLTIGLYGVDNHYVLYFYRVERTCGWCQCTPKDAGYNAKHKCCGHECDWAAPAISILKFTGLGTIEWNGDASTYWAYQEQFKLNQERHDKEAAAFTRKQRRESLLSQIEQYQEDLRQLDAEEADS